MTPQHPQDLFRLKKKKKRIHHTPPLILQKKTQLDPKEPNRPKGKVDYEGPSYKKRMIRAIDVPQAGNPK